MAPDAPTIRVTPGSELDLALEQARRGPIVVERDDARYRVHVEPEDIWADYDGEAALAAFDATAGSWAELDADRLIAELYRAREEGSRPPGRP